MAGHNGESPRLADYLRDWLAAQRTQLQPTTWVEYRGQITRYIEPHLGDQLLEALDPGDIEATYARLLTSGGRNGKPLSLRRTVCAYSTVRSALGDAVERGLVERNAAALARPPRVDPFRDEDDRDSRIWTAEQLRCFLAHVADHEWRPLWRLAASTGMRRGEMLALRWSDVDLDGGLLRVRRSLTVVEGDARLKRTKTLRERTIRIDPTLVDALADRSRRQATQRRTADQWRDRWGLVFTHPDGRLIDPMEVTKEFRRLVRNAPVPVVRLHDLRHVHATLLLGDGVPVKVVSERLGHANIQTTLDRYAHVLPAMDADAVARFSRLLGVGEE
jgi:integrase